jgi:hypothetical protein
VDSARIHPTPPTTRARATATTTWAKAHQGHGRQPERARRQHRAGREPGAQPRQQGGAGHRADPDAAEQQSVAAGAKVQRRPGHQRQQSPDRAGEEDEQGCPEQDHPQHRAGRHVAAARPDGLADVLARERARRPGGGTPRGDHRDHGDERGRVHDEDGPGAGGRQQGPADGGADGAGEVLVDGAKRDRLRTFGRIDQFGLEGLPGRRGQRLAGPGREQQREQHPGGDQAGQGQHAQRGRRDQHDGLGDQQEAPPVHQVADRPGQHREQHHRQPGRRLDERDVDRRGGQAQHQPLGRHRLHPAADVADELRAPHRREQAMAERRPGAIRPRGWHGGILLPAP